MRRGAQERGGGGSGGWTLKIGVAEHRRPPFGWTAIRQGRLGRWSMVATVLCTVAVVEERMCLAAQLLAAAGAQLVAARFDDALHAVVLAHLRVRCSRQALMHHTPCSW
jgi:hypothetical protein